MKHIYFRECTQELLELPITVENCYYLGEFDAIGIFRLELILENDVLSFWELRKEIKKIEDDDTRFETELPKKPITNLYFHNQFPKWLKSITPSRFEYEFLKKLDGNMQTCRVGEKGVSKIIELEDNNFSIQIGSNSVRIYYPFLVEYDE
jgi:hypothetical protein